MLDDDCKLANAEDVYGMNDDEPEDTDADLEAVLADFGL
jgi:hypothetical protein